MAAMAMAMAMAMATTSTSTSTSTSSALESSMASLYLSSSNQSFFGHRFSLSTTSFPVKSAQKPCLVFARLKRWERKECKPNSLPVLQKMHVKLGDTIKVISGREKGKIGEIVKIFKHDSTVIVKDLNLKTKHVKSKDEGEPGQIIKIEGQIHSSNVMLYSKEKEVASRVGHKILEDGSRVCYLIKTGEIIDSAESWKKIKETRRSKESKLMTSRFAVISIPINVSPPLSFVCNVEVVL